MKQLFPILILLMAISCSSETSVDELYKTGLIHFNNKEYLHALHSFDELIRQDDSFAMAYLKRAQIHLIKDDYEAAYSDLNRFLEFDTLVSEGYTQRAILKFSLTDYYGALSDCNKALESDNANADAYRIRGRIKKQFGNNPGAFSDLSQAINLNDQDKKSYFLRGDVNLVLGNSTEACEDYNLAAELGSMQAYKRIVEYCSEKDTEVKVVTIEKPVEIPAVKETIEEKEKIPAEKFENGSVDEAEPLDKWHRLVDIRSNIFQVHSLSINRQIKKGEAIEWGNMGSMDKSYVLVKEKENQVFNLQFIVDGEKTYEGFYTYTDARENNITIYRRVDKPWDEILISDKPFEFVLDRLQTEGRTTIEIIDYHRGVGAKVLF